MSEYLALEFTTGSYEAAQAIGILVIQAIQEELSGERAGRWYPLPNNMLYSKLTPKDQRASNYHVKYTGTLHREDIEGAAYQASAPGEPPASRTGRLRQSFYIVILLLDIHIYKVKIISSVYYASDLEFGNEKLSARPFIVPAINKNLDKIIALDMEFHYRVLKGE